MNKNDSLTAALKFAPLLEKYFLTYLIAQKKSSPRTVPLIETVSRFILDLWLLYTA